MDDSEVEKVMHQIQKQVSEEFARAGYTDAKLKFVGKNESPEPSTWRIIISDEDIPEEAPFTGYHGMNKLLDVPEGFVFLKTIAKSGDWSITASHEVLEMLGNPFVDRDRIREIQVRKELLITVTYSFEVCDQVGGGEEKGWYTKTGSEVKLSNFVIPEWFEERSILRAIKEYDHLGKIVNPFDSPDDGVDPISKIEISGEISRKGFLEICRILQEEKPISKRVVARKFINH